MIGAGIDDGDILVIDRSLEPRNNAVAVCFIDGEFTVKESKNRRCCFSNARKLKLCSYSNRTT